MTPSLKTEFVPETDSGVASSPPVVASATAGQLLREARLKAGMHLAVLSVTLKVPVRQLEALEGDELDPGKGPVFYRGLASSVCRHLQTDATPILALLPQTTAQLQPLRSSIEPFESDASVGISSLPWGQMLSSKVIWGAALMVLLTAAFLWLPSPAQWAWLDDVKSLMAEEVVSQEVGDSIPVTPVLVPAAALPPVVLPSATATSSSVSVASAPLPTQLNVPTVPLSPPVLSNVPAKPAVIPPSAVALRSDAAPEWVFSAKGDSWLEVRNAQRAVVWSGVVKAGESTRIQSPLPVSVVVGRAEVVTATLRGQPFDLKPHTQTTVARFEVKE